MITAFDLVNLFYLRRLISPTETETQSLAAVKAHVLKAQQYIASLTDQREWIKTPAEIAAENAARLALDTARVARESAILAWIKMHSESAGKTFEECAKLAGIP